MVIEIKKHFIRIPLLSINNVNKGTTQLNYNFESNDNSNYANKGMNSIMLGNVTKKYNMILSEFKD